MSDDKTILEGPDGRLYEIPNDALASYAVAGARVVELRKAMAPTNGASVGGSAGDSTHGHFGPDNIPPGHPAASVPATSAGSNGQMQSMTIPTGANGSVTLNFFFSGAQPEAVAPEQHDTGLEGYHMSFNEIGIPVNHTEMLWGDYMDKQGNPSVGWHSHDPVTGNAQ